MFLELNTEYVEKDLKIYIRIETKYFCLINDEFSLQTELKKFKNTIQTQINLQQKYFCSQIIKEIWKVEVSLHIH